MTTFNTTPKDIKREWKLVDAKGQVLGRLATQIAKLLQGKHKTYYVSHLDCGDYVVVTNSDKVKVTGKKAEKKEYYTHSNYPGGFKVTHFATQMQKDSRRIIIHAVSRMLPKNKLRAERLKRLKVFKTEKQPYAIK
jgi:large subunit ribosomal protein L13